MISRAKQERSSRNYLNVWKQDKNLVAVELCQPVNISDPNQLLSTAFLSFIAESCYVTLKIKLLKQKKQKWLKLKPTALCPDRSGISSLNKL